MMSPLAILTRGRLSPSTEKALTLITMGWISVSSGQPQPHQEFPSSSRILEQVGGKPGRIDIMRKMDDDYIYNILKIWTQCQG